MDDHLRFPAAARARRTAVRGALAFALTFFVGVPVAYLSAVRSSAEYTARGTFWIEVESPEEVAGVVPIRTASAGSDAWVQLLRSYAVLDDVVRDRRLYLEVEGAASRALASFDVADDFTPGSYALRVDEDGETFRLVDGNGVELHRGTVGSPVGPALGFVWAPDRGELMPGEEVAFTLRGARDVARDVAGSLTTDLDGGEPFLRVSLTGDDPETVVEVLNAAMGRSTALAADLKRSRLATFERVLTDQLAEARSRLVEAERDLETFRIETIVQASDRPRRDLLRDAEEARLRREVVVAEDLYNEIRGRVEQARVAAAQAMPDIRILDRAQLSARPRVVSLPLAALIFLAFAAASLPLAAVVERIARFDAE